MHDQDKLILVAVGPDRLGLVQIISRFIVDRGCNIEDSKMAVFAGEFALIVLVSGLSQNLNAISHATSELESATGLNIWVKRPTEKRAGEPSLPYQLVASCMDHPGIVNRISSTVSACGANIESMETQTYAAPVSGTPIFRLEAIITVPATFNINSLRSRFEEIEREENIDIDLTLIKNL